jgi:hypothetical protein
MFAVSISLICDVGLLIAPSEEEIVAELTTGLQPLRSQNTLIVTSQAQQGLVCNLC